MRVTLTLFGAGAQAAAQMEAVCAVRTIEQAYVVTRSGQKDVDFRRGDERATGYRCVCPRAMCRAAVEAADVICTATSSATPVFARRMAAAGDAHQRGRRLHAHDARTGRATQCAAAASYVDRHAAAQAEAGDILLAIEDGALTYDHVAGELGEVMLGTCARAHEMTTDHRRSSRSVWPCKTP